MKKNTKNHHRSTRHTIIKSLKKEANAKCTLSQKIADAITTASGSMLFLLINASWFALWIVINIGVIPGVKAFDPYPFGLLTMVVSLEAIILAVIVLISQNRAGEVAEVREEIDLHVDIIAEQEITKIMALLTVLAEKNGINLSKDRNLKEMLKPTDIDKIKEILEKGK